MMDSTINMHPYRSYQIKRVIQLGVYFIEIKWKKKTAYFIKINFFRLDMQF